MSQLTPLPSAAYLCHDSRKTYLTYHKMHITAVIFLAAAGSAWIAPTGHPDGVYSVQTHENGAETHTFIAVLPPASNFSSSKHTRQRPEAHK